MSPHPNAPVFLPPPGHADAALPPEAFQRHVIDKLGALHEQVDTLSSAMSPAQLEKAVASGIRAAATDPELWAAMMAAVRMQAKAEAGGWLFGGIKAMLNRAAWVAVIGMGIYLVGGWSALVAMVKSPPVGQ